MATASTNALNQHELHSSNANRLLPFSRRVLLRHAAWCALGLRPSLIMSPQREADGLKAQFDFVIKAS